MTNEDESYERENGGNRQNKGRPAKEIYKPKKRITDLGLEAQFSNLSTQNDEPSGEHDYRRGQNGNRGNYRGRGDRRGGRGDHRGRGRRGRGGRGRGGIIQDGYMSNDGDDERDNRDRRTEDRNDRYADNRQQYTFNQKAADKANKPKEKSLKMVTGPNTVSWKRDYSYPEMLVNFVSGNLCSTYDRPMTSRDVCVVNDLFCMQNDLSIYNLLLEEIQSCGIDHEKLFKLWHGNTRGDPGTHLIADDGTNWKKSCPTFNMVLEKIVDFFKMDVKATRFNWYRDSNDWKPYHHDAAAVKPDKAKTQNLTVAVSFGAERQAAFEHAKTKTTISMWQPNGTIYTFGRDVNVMWRHGIPAVHPDQYTDQGRISIIAWGLVDYMEDVD